MKSITTTNTVTTSTTLLVLLLSSLGAHLGHAFPSSSSQSQVVGESTSFLPNVPITSAEKPGLISSYNPTSSRGIEEIPSQSKSEATSNKWWKWLSPPRTSAPPPQQDSNLTYYYSYQENKNYSQVGVQQLSPTQPNGKRQIGNSSGNPISLDLHDKVNVEWEEEEVKVGGRRRRDGVRVTDVNPKFGFQAGSEASIHLQTEEDDAIAKPDTVALLLLPQKKKNVNVDPFIFMANNNVTKRYSSVSIKNKAFPAKGEEDGESSTTQFSSKDNSKNETETNRTYIHPWDGPGQNSKTGSISSKGEIQSDDVVNIGAEDTAVEDDSKKQRLVSKYPQRNGDLYFTPMKTGSETKTPPPPPSCLPIVVNQTFTVRKYGGIRTPTLDPDMDKWTSVKMSQCVATCIGRLSFGQKYNMSPRKKGINEGGGFPVRIAAPLPSPNYNGDITSSQNHFDDELLLSSCQKSCNFLPQKSSNSPISIARNWKEAEEETNKVNDPAEDVSSKRVVGRGDGSNHEVGVKARGKNDKNSSVRVDAKRKIIATTTTTQFHLHWPKVISLASSSIIKNKSPVILYNVMVLEQGNDETTQQQQQRLLPPRWKLIDQTVETQTQISLLTWHGPCSRLKPKSHHHSGSPQETIILDELHDHLVQQHEPILLKVVAVGSQGVEKVFSGLIILTSAAATPSSPSQSEDEDKSKSTLESTCCQSSINGAEMQQHFDKKVKGISNPQRNSDATRAIILMSQENKNLNNISSSPDESGRSLFVAGGSNNSPSKQRQPPNLSASETLVVLNGDKNSEKDIIASNKINFKESSSTRTWLGSSNKTRTRAGGRGEEEVSYKVESDPNTGGQIDTDNNSNEVKDKEGDANRKSTTEPSFQRHDSLRGGSNPVLSSKTTFTTKSQQQFMERNGGSSSKKLVQPPTSKNDVDDEKNDANKDDWGLRAVSMVYQNFLVVTEVRWNVPGGSVSNQEEDKKNASSDKNNNSAATVKSSNLVTEPESGGESKQEGTRYQFLLTWEILGGGLKGNLVTDIAGGTINLWPDTAYFVQVGLLDPDTPSSSSSEGKLPSSTSSSEQEQHQNYMSNLLGMESIIFPLADPGTGQPKLTSTSQPLLVNTSSVATSQKLSIPAQSSSPSPSLSQRSRNLLLLPKRNDDKTRHKSNNLPPNGEEKSRRGKYLPPRTYRYNNEPSSKVKVEVVVDKKKADSVLNRNVRPITIPGGGTVSTNGNDHSHLTKNKNVRPSSSSSSSSSLDEVGDHHSAPVQQPLLDHGLLHSKKYYQKNYSGGGRGPSDNGPPSSFSSHHGMMGDSPGGKSLLVRGNNDKLLEGDDDEKLFHGHPHHQPQYRNHYLVGTAGNAKTTTTNSTTTNDKTANINDNKSNNLEKERNIKKKANGGGGTEHHRNNPAAADTHLGSAYRPEGYQGLFALNLGLGGYNYNYDHNEDGETTENESNKFGNGTNSRSGDTGASVIYSIFVLVVVACVIFLFLVAFIGFFVVTSSITHTAHYFIPKRLRIWVVGGNSESELLAGNEQDAENEENEAGFVDGRFVEDLDDDVPEWGDDVGGGGREGHHHHHTQQDVLMTHRDIGRT